MTERFLVEVSQNRHQSLYIAKVIRETLEKVPAISSLSVSVITQSSLRCDERFRKIVPGAICNDNTCNVDNDNICAVCGVSPVDIDIHIMYHSASSRTILQLLEEIRRLEKMVI